MFPNIPSDLTSLSDDELDALHDELVAYFAENVEAGRTDTAVAANLATVTEAVQNVRAEQDARDGALSVDDMAAIVMGDGNAAGDGDTPAGDEPQTPPAAPNDQPTSTPETEPAAPGQQPEDFPEGSPQRGGVADPDAIPSTAPGNSAQPEPVSAAGRRRGRAPLRAARPAADRQPTSPSTPTQRPFRASADVPGHGMGQPLESREDVAEALLSRWGTIRGARGGQGEFIPVATFDVEYPAERTLDDSPAALDSNGFAVRRNLDANEPTLRQGMSAITAAGLCAPTEGWYDNQVLATASRPVRDSLPSYNAGRGGIRLVPPAKLSDLTAGITTVTNAQDIAASVTKACVEINCAAQREYVVTAVNACLKASNFGARAYPEQVAAWLQNLEAAHARVAETLLLDGIAAASISLTSAGLVGAAREIIARLGQAAAAYRSRNRMDEDARLNVYVPAWAINLAAADVARSFGGTPQEYLSFARADLVAGFGAQFLDVTFYLDSKTGGGQVFAAEVAASVLDNFPTVMFAYVFAPGTFVFLDGGNLDFGLVRDSALNSANRFTMQSETFEQVAYVGTESIEVALTLCADGSYGAARSVTCPIVT